MAKLFWRSLQPGLTSDIAVAFSAAVACTVVLLSAYLLGAA